MIDWYSDIKLQFQEIFDEVKTGMNYRVTLSYGYSDKETRERIVKVHSKKRHDEYSYSFACTCLDSGGFIHYWLVPRWMMVFNERISKIEEYNA